MKVTISCCGKFHAFNLAEQLDKYGHLHKLITLYYSQKRKFLPLLRNDLEVINPDKIVTNVFPFVLSNLINNTPFLKNFVSSDISTQFFDEWAKGQIDPCDIVVAWSNSALNTLRVAKSYGSITIVERGSTHILFQKEILEEEYAKHNIKTSAIDDNYVHYELAQYLETDYISVPSKFAKQTYIDRGIDPAKLIQVPYGVNLDIFKPVLKEDNIFRIISVGNFSIRKGIHYLLQAFSELKLKNSELVLIGPISSEIKTFLKKYRDCYKHLGAIPHLQLYKYLSQGSVFVLPSIEEGLAMVIPQAMACGLPVICTTNTGGSDIIRDGIEGFNVPIRDINALKEKILYLYEHDEERKHMSENALKRAKEFTWDNYGEKIVAEYKKILSSRIS